MSTTEQDLGRDIRHWLGNNPQIASEHTARRINASYSHIESVLDRCDGLSRAASYDLGCQAGLVSFALASQFDRVLAIDPDVAAIREAEAIATGTGVTNIRFDRFRAEYYEPSEVFSFVYCNLMSHNVDSRSLLAVRIAMCLEDGGWLHYAEEQEGYGPLELHRGIQRQDVAAVSERLRQILRGFTCRKGFRFFVGGSMEPLLDVLGFRCDTQETSKWNGMQYQETLLCTKDGVASQTEPDGTDPDYLRVPDEFAEIRNRFSEWIARRSGDTFDRSQQAAIADEAAGSSNRYAPFLNILLMSDSALLSLDANQTSNRDELDWPSLEEMDRRFIRQMRRHAGLEEGPIDD